MSEARWATLDPEASEPGRPGDCECWDATLDLPCWPCYRDGFDTQNPAEPGREDSDE